MITAGERPVSDPDELRAALTKVWEELGPPEERAHYVRLVVNRLMAIAQRRELPPEQAKIVRRSLRLASRKDSVAALERCVSLLNDTAEAIEALPRPVWLTLGEHFFDTSWRPTLPAVLRARGEELQAIKESIPDGPAVPRGRRRDELAHLVAEVVLEGWEKVTGGDADRAANKPGGAAGLGAVADRTSEFLRIPGGRDAVERELDRRAKGAAAPPDAGIDAGIGNSADEQKQPTERGSRRS